jgi:integrase
MPRQVKDAKIGNRTARSKLKKQGKPYYREISPGLHLGYRKLKTGGKWVVRVYLEGKYLTETLAVADDHDEADSIRILDYGQAQKLARKRATELRAANDSGHVGPYTVKAALDDYLGSLKREGRDGREVRRRIGHIKKALGDKQLAKLRKADIENWLHKLANTPPKLRSGKPAPVDMDDPEVQRKRKDTANRFLTDLKAALNFALDEGKAANDIAWRKVKPYKSVSAAKVRYLSLNEVKRLLNASQADLRALIQGALLTGARLSDLCEMKVGDFLPDAHAVIVKNSKAHHAGKKPFPCYLSPEGMEFFQAHTAGRDPGRPMFEKADGEAFVRHDIYRPINSANEAAKLDPRATFNSLRHTYASQSIMNGVPLMVVAQNLGHSDTRMVEEHYGHLAKNYIRDAIAKGLPTWGVKTDQKVVNIQ